MCCLTCALDSEGASEGNDSYMMGHSQWKSDTLVLLRLLPDLGFRSEVESKIVCDWPVIDCHEDLYNVLRGGVGSDAVLNSSVGSLRHVKRVDLSRNRIRGQIKEIMNCFFMLGERRLSARDTRDGKPLVVFFYVLLDLCPGQ